MRHAAINEYVAHHNIKPKPFIWTKGAADILPNVIRANACLSSKQNEALHQWKPIVGQEATVDAQLAMLKKKLEERS